MAHYTNQSTAHKNKDIGSNLPMTVHNQYDNQSTAHKNQDTSSDPLIMAFDENQNFNSLHSDPPNFDTITIDVPILRNSPNNGGNMIIFFEIFTYF